jgi:hypothetical protein
MKAYGGVDVYTHVFLNSALVGGAAPHEKPKISQVVLKIPTFSGTSKFINIFATARQWTLS